MKAKPKPKMRIKKAVFKKKNGRFCPVHDTEMEYLSDELMWVCHTEGCRYREYPEIIENGVPIHAVGKNTLVVTANDDGEQTFLLMSENNVFLTIPREAIEFKEEGMPSIKLTVSEVKKV